MSLEGLVHNKGMCTVLDGLDGVPRRITWSERQKFGFENAKVLTGANGSTGLGVEFLVQREIEAGRAPRS